jgi:hypothetical protein
MQAELDDRASKAPDTFGSYRLVAARCVQRWALADAVPLTSDLDDEVVLLESTSEGWRLLTFGTDLGPVADYGIPQADWDRLIGGP